jgi:hypothetical protein
MSIEVAVEKVRTASALGLRARPVETVVAPTSPTKIIDELRFCTAIVVAEAIVTGVLAVKAKGVTVVIGII